MESPFAAGNKPLGPYVLVQPFEIIMRRILTGKLKTPTRYNVFYCGIFLVVRNSGSSGDGGLVFSLGGERRRGDSEMLLGLRYGTGISPLRFADGINRSSELPTAGPSDGRATWAFH